MVQGDRESLSKSFRNDFDHTQSPSLWMMATTNSACRFFASNDPVRIIFGIKNTQLHNNKNLSLFIPYFFLYLSFSISFFFSLSLSSFPLSLSLEYNFGFGSLDYLSFLWSSVVPWTRWFSLQRSFTLFFLLSFAYLSLFHSFFLSITFAFLSHSNSFFTSYIQQTLYHRQCQSHPYPNGIKAEKRNLSPFPSRMKWIEKERERERRKEMEYIYLESNFIKNLSPKK